MAGRVERRNKYYFVLDEVGDSDCDSESTPTVPDKSGNDFSKNCNLSDEDDVPSKKSRKDNSPVKDTFSLNKDENVTKITSVEQNNKPIESSDLDKYKDKSCNGIVSNANLSSEETTAVDMDIDYDSDCVESNISQKPLIKVTFRDETVENFLKTSLIKFLSKKIRDCTVITNSENSLEFEVFDKDPRKLFENNLLDFDFDTTPGSSNSEVPYYGQSHDLILSDKTPEKPQSGKLYASTKTCFNCLGNHNLRDCQERKNFDVINQNRLKFQSQCKTSKNSRYHLDENQKFSHIEPGVISKKLKNALNLKHNQQPKFIYRMRLLGYPPAWLEEARVSYSGVAMYDQAGSPVLEEDEEEGEIIPEGFRDKFDTTKIIDFPGFNVPLPHDYKDETKYYSCPAFSPDQSKENLVKLLEPKSVQAYVKKSLSTPKLDKKCAEQEDVKQASSPTIEEMEEKKRQLLMELKDEDSGSDIKLNSEDSFSGAGVAESDTSQNVQISEQGRVKNSEFGTPILKSVSPFAKLPSLKQFSVNVSDVINFENLPNSTGKYETMRHVISKIRTSISKIQKE